MPRIPVHTVDDAPEGAQPMLRQLRQKFGKVLNIHGEMAHSPAVLAGYAGIQQAIGDYGSFDAGTQEAIALVIGAADDCGYCQAAHTAGAKQAGWTVEQTIALRSGEPLPEQDKLDALLAVAREVATAVGNVNEATWQRALDAGWTDTELSELFVHVIGNLFTNYFNHYAHTELDLPAAPALR